MRNSEIRKIHGDHKRWSIKLWREEIDQGKTELDYIDWRADKKWCETEERLK